MNRKPKPKNESIFAHGLGLQVVLQGFMFALLTLAGFWYGRQVTGQIKGGQSMAFIILAVSQIVQAFNMRSSRSLFKIKPFSNKSLNMATLISLSLVILVVVSPLHLYFGLIHLPLSLYITAIGLSLMPLAVMEASKAYLFIKLYMGVKNE